MQKIFIDLFGFSACKIRTLVWYKPIKHYVITTTRVKFVGKTGGGRMKVGIQGSNIAFH
jgi:hypothetical protein